MNWPLVRSPFAFAACRDTDSVPCSLLMLLHASAVAGVPHGAALLTFCGLQILSIGIPEIGGSIVGQTTVEDVQVWCALSAPCEPCQCAHQGTVRNYDCSAQVQSHQEALVVPPRSVRSNQALCLEQAEPGQSRGDCMHMQAPYLASPGRFSMPSWAMPPTWFGSRAAGRHMAPLWLCTSSR